MNIFERQKMNLIEGFDAIQIRSILNELDTDGLPKIDSIVFDSILLTDGKTIKCIRNYYRNLNGKEPRKAKGNSSCTLAQKFFDIQCRPFDCIRCHKIMLQKRNNKEVRPR